jgi:hypothetical protein
MDFEELIVLTIGDVVNFVVATLEKTDDHGVRAMGA